MTARIEPEWLLDLFPDRVEERSNVMWNRATERVEKVSALLYDKLVIEESRGVASEAEASDLLARRALEIGIDHFVEKEALAFSWLDWRLRALRLRTFPRRFGSCAWDFKASTI